MNRAGRQRGIGADHGAYAVMYAVLTTVLVGVAAIVVDLAALRLDRRTDRAAADAAAIAGAGQLGELGQNAAGACDRALDYIAAVLNADRPGDSCGDLPSTCDPISASTASPDARIGGRDITITWPVPDSHHLMTEADVEGSAADDASAALEAINAESDGDPCQRIGVQISHDREFVFGGIFGSVGATTTSHSVALALEGSGGSITVPMIALAGDPEDTCPDDPSISILEGDVDVDESAESLGEIAIDANGSSCPVIDVESGSLSADRVGIFMLGNVSYPPSLTNLIARAWQVTDRPWRDRYNCMQANPILCGLPTASLTPADYVDQWRDYADGLTVEPPDPPEEQPRRPSPTDPSWTILNGGPCTADPPYTTNVYADCSTLTIGTLTFPGQLVATGDVTVNGAVAFGGRVDISGDLTISTSASVEASDDVIVRGDLDVAGTARIEDPYLDRELDVGGHLIVSGLLDAEEATHARANLLVASTGTFEAEELYVGSDFIVNGTADLQERTEVRHQLEIRGSGGATFMKRLLVRDDLDVSGSASLTSHEQLIVQNKENNSSDHIRGVRVRDSACLFVSRAKGLTCADSLPSASADAQSVFVGGRLSVASEASFVAHKSFVYVTDRVAADTIGRVHLWAPASGDCTGASSGPPPACFEDLAVWAAGMGQNVLTISGTDEIEGTFFAPNGDLKVSWSGDVSLDHAQFVAQRLIFDGSDQLTIRPDPERTTLIPQSAGVLIR